MILSTFFPSLILLSSVFVASAAKHDSIRPLHRRTGISSSSTFSSPRLLARQDEESACPDCLAVTDIGNVCIAALPAGTSETGADGLPPQNDCFCTQKLFDLSHTCAACLQADGSEGGASASAEYLVGFDDFRAACISAGFAITPSTASEATKVVASTTSSVGEDSSSVTSAAPEEATTAPVTTTSPKSIPSSAVTTQRTSATTKAAQSSSSKSAVASASSTGGAQGRAMVHAGLAAAVGLVVVGVAL